MLTLVPCVGNIGKLDLGLQGLESAELMHASVTERGGEAMVCTLGGKSARGPGHGGLPQGGPQAAAAAVGDKMPETRWL